MRPLQEFEMKTRYYLIGEGELLVLLAQMEESLKDFKETLKSKSLIFDGALEGEDIEIMFGPDFFYE